PPSMPGSISSGAFPGTLPAESFSKGYLGRVYRKGTMETSFDEKFALAADRAQALQQLIPGTEEYYYYSCLLQEQLGKPEEARKLLDTWIQRHGRTSRV